MADSELTKAVLLHLGMNMWHPSYAQLQTTDAFWRQTVDALVKAGMNMLLVDVGEGVVLPSHPELSVRGSWSAEKMRAEIARIRKLGVEVVPKLNFSATHDAWLGEYSRMVSTPKYYEVVRDVIRDVAEIFGKPRLFHLGWDEETYDHQSGYDYVVVRSEDLWWHDFLYTIDCCGKTGARPWVWSDFGWHHADYVKRCPKSVLQSNWYYDESDEGFDLSDPRMDSCRPYVQLFLDLDRAGFDQIPCGTNWVGSGRKAKGMNADDVIGRLVDFSRKNISKERLKGFLMTSWVAMDTPENMKTILDGIRLFVRAVR